MDDLSLRYGDIAYDFDNVNKVKTYIKINMFHINRFRQELDVIKKIVSFGNMPGDNQIDFFKKLVSYERKNQYNYTKSTYKTICGICIELLLPRGIKTKDQTRKVINSFMKQINPIDYKVPWIAYEENRGTARVLKILLSEREYIDHVEVRQYNRNYYDRNGNITHKKGDVMMKKGKPIKQHVLWSNKVRLFTFAKATFKQLVTRLTDSFLIAIKAILHINTRFRIKQKNAKAKWHFYNRSACTEINTLKQFVAFHCNHAVYLQRDRSYNPQYEDYIGKSIPVPKLREITDLFHKYKARFEKQCFHDCDGSLRYIAYKNVELPTLKLNLLQLRDEFKKELGTIVQKAFQ